MDDDGDDKDDSKRRTRNLSEKKRRDQFNMLINELSLLVTTHNRKMDKSTVLKSTITFLKNHNEITLRSRAHDIQDDWKPSFLSNEEFTYLVLEAVEGFVMVFSTSGRLYYVSESITSLLGYNPAEIINKCLFEFIYEEDKQILFNLLQNPGTVTDQPYPTKENEIKFQCHVKRAPMDYPEDTCYDLIQFRGYFRSNVEPLHIDDIARYQPGNEKRLIFVCTGSLSNPQLTRDVSLGDSNRNEFTSRHSLEWKFLFIDHRAAPILGYLPFELLGTSGYDYYHFDDLEKLVSCHEALMQKGEVTSHYYRFLTKGQQWIWLQSRLYITYHQWNSKPEFIVCTHKVVSYSELEQHRKRQDMDDDIGDIEVNRSRMENPRAGNVTATESPNYGIEGNEQYGNLYLPLSQPASVKSSSACSTSGTVSTIGTMATAAVSWPHSSHAPYHGSDTASVSGESRSSMRNNSNDRHKVSEPELLPQHGIGVQYLEPAPYVATVKVTLPQPPTPVAISPNQAQLQEQLQRKHEMLQLMIMRQTEELRQVKEQLLLARLGILQPVINLDPNQNIYVNPEEIQEGSHLLALPPDYDRAESRGSSGYDDHQPANSDQDNYSQ